MISDCWFSNSQYCKVGVCSTLLYHAVISVIIAVTYFVCGHTNVVVYCRIIMMFTYHYELWFLDAVKIRYWTLPSSSFSLNSNYYYYTRF